MFVRNAEIELSVKKSRNDYPARFRLIVADVESDGQRVRIWKCYGTLVKMFFIFLLISKIPYTIL